ncbi:MAG: amidohydrolase family protein, partial [Anaerolineales bacterium]|nr:amidohydrolase family protein [Anaerolineales bacterium]
LERYQKRAANVAYMIPHGAVRVEIMGWAARAATGPELIAMQDLVNQGMAQGAAGISTGLSYIPCSHAATGEMIALCEPVAEAGGILSVHMRSYIGELMPAIDEVIEIGRRSGVAVQISHLRMCDPAVWGQSEAVLEKLDNAREKGVDVTYDIYPYTIGSAPLFAMLPAWAQAGGPDEILSRLKESDSRNKIIQDMETWPTDWPLFFLSNARVTELGDFAGLSLPEAAKSVGVNTLEFILTLLVETELDATIVSDGGNEADNDVMFGHPAAMVCSDGLMIGQKPHPRGFGAFPRVLDRYVRQKGIQSWEQAVQKMTGLPAARLGLTNRGTIQRDNWADIVVFSPDTVADYATVHDGRKPPTGIHWVLVNGHVVVDNCQFVGGHYGQVV